MFATVTVAVRGMTKTESANTLLMWQMVTLAIFHSTLLGFGFRWPSLADAAMLVVSGAANAAGQYLWTRSLLLAPAAAVSPFYYLMLVWALVIGFLVWGDMPTIGLLAGSTVVVGSGLFLLWHETQRRAAGDAAAKLADDSSEQQRQRETDYAPLNEWPAGTGTPPHKQ